MINNINDKTFYNTLPVNIVLTSGSCKYVIEKVLGQGSYGITYLATVQLPGNLDRLPLKYHVTIKEFFFKNYCEREEETSHVTLSTKSNKELVERFRKKFLKEARVISKLHQDHIVQIYIFEENTSLEIERSQERSIPYQTIHEENSMNNPIKVPYEMTPVDGISWRLGNTSFHLNELSRFSLVIILIICNLGSILIIPEIAEIKKEKS